MAQKMLLRVQLPAACTASEFWVPRELTAYEAARLVARLFEQTHEAFFTDEGQAALYSLRTGEELKADACIGDCGLRDGDDLMLA
ncbi:MAG: hypothetical protein LBG81_00650 [Coriobacteriaceae bacterium]|jgi:hypothetical protein|nr:hypothetical protein [Coriobacteriaceae bacterium]